MGHGERHSLRPLLDSEDTRFRCAQTMSAHRHAGQDSHVTAGDTVTIEPLQGDRTPRLLTMTGT